MFLVDAQNKATKALDKRDFSELGLQERFDLQAWIIDNPSILQEELLIIQEEFSGFSTFERLDLLALDKFGNLVIIENKTDDSGRDVVWQAQKYASYCATLKHSDILNIYQDFLDKHNHGENAEEQLAQFFDEDVMFNQDQRIVLVAANFRKEVTSTVLWLRDKGLDIRCVKVGLFQAGEQIFLDSHQILPMLDVAEYQIGLASKKREDLVAQKDGVNWSEINREFWAMCLPELRKSSPIFNNISPTSA